MKNLTVDCQKLIDTLLQKLQQIESSESDFFTRTTACLTLCVEHLDELRAQVAGYHFPDTAAEIHFFKKVKPAILSRIIYYRKVMDLHLDICPGCGHIEEQQLTAALHASTQFFERNRGFYNYYRMGATQYDEALFVRGRSGVNLFRNSNYDVDPVFSTGYDGKLAKFMAHELFVEYVNRRLCPGKGGENNHVKPVTIPTLPWTGSVTDIVETGYGWFTAGYCGIATIKEVMEVLSIIFKKDLGDYYGTFIQICERKINRTKCLDNIKDSLTRYMDRLNESD